MSENGRGSERLWQALAMITVICLVAITATVVRREFFAGRGIASPSAQVAETGDEGTPPSRAPLEPPVQLSSADWARVKSTGHRIGPADAPVTIVVFSDFQCPACGGFETRTLPALQERYPGKFALLFRHWPLSGHKFAYDAAIAAECAAQQGQFEQFHNMLFAHPLAIGEKPFSQFASEAGVKQAGAFATCLKNRDGKATIDADIAEARRIGGRGTPTIVVNGLRLRPPFSPDAIGGYIEAALANPKQF